MAAKYYYKDVYQSNRHKDMFLQMIVNEANILRRMNHPGIVKVYELYQMPDKVMCLSYFF